MTEVLLIEDDPTVAEVLGLYLGQAGLNVCPLRWTPARSRGR